MTKARWLLAAMILIAAVLILSPLQFMAGLVSPHAVRFFDRAWARILVYAFQIKGV